MSQTSDLGLMVETTPRGEPRIVLYSRQNFSVIATLPLEDIFEAWERWKHMKED